MKELSDCTVLLVDDTEANVDILVDALGKSYEVSVAMDGPSALDAVAEIRPDLILLDIMMPGMDGYEVCRQLRENEKSKETPVIFLTAKSEKEDIVTGFEAGGQDYIIKPFYIPELMERVRTQLILKCQKEALQTVNQHLEEKVAERTRQLEEANRNLEIANRELTSLDDAKNRFLDLISHEIRTPLNGILGVTDLLKEMLGEESEFSEFLDMLKISADRLEAFSATALTITHLQTKHEGVAKCRLDPFLCLEMVSQELEGEAEKKSVNIDRIGREGRYGLQGNEELVLRALRSILDNGIRYAPDSSTLQCTVSEEGGNVVFEVVDRGNGFSEEALKNLFKPFGLGEPHYDENVGLSLLATKLIAEAHGGHIEIGNHQDGGAVVRLCFQAAH